MRSVLAHAQLAVGRLAPARATAERALAELARVAGLREAVGRSTAPAFCRIWWALASAYLGNAAEAQAGLEALLAEEKERALQALYGTHGFLCEVLRLRGDLPGALAHGRRAVELAEERGSPFSRVEAAAFLGAAELADGDVAAATSALEPALGLARIEAHRAVVRAAHPGDARGREAGRRRSLRSPRAPRRSARVRRAGAGLAARRLRRRAGAGAPPCLGARPGPHRDRERARVRGRPRDRARRRSLSAHGGARARAPRTVAQPPRRGLAPFHGSRWRWRNAACPQRIWPRWPRRTPSCSPPPRRGTRRAHPGRTAARARPRARRAPRAPNRMKGHFRELDVLRVEARGAQDGHRPGVERAGIDHRRRSAPDDPRRSRTRDSLRPWPPAGCRPSPRAASGSARRYMRPPRPAAP